MFDRVRKGRDPTAPRKPGPPSMPKGLANREVVTTPSCSRSGFFVLRVVHIDCRRVTDSRGKKFSSARQAGTDHNFSD